MKRGSPENEPRFGRAAIHFKLPKLKMLFQSFFMLITIQRFFLASAMRASEKVRQ
jgi:hypothetical protein